MTAYYNEIDPYAAQWLRNLIDAGHIAPGDVDERSIVDVSADDLRGYTQSHFFAGIGGWSVALRLAGWPDDRPVWTGSCPCQPFSAAGAGKAADDGRHLWPAWFPLIAQRRPPTVFGEQVEAAIGWGWLDAVCADMEGEGYACGAAVLPACGVGAPHIRNRIWFVADAEGERERSGIAEGNSSGRKFVARSGTRGDSFDNGKTCDMADADGGNASTEGLQRGGEHGQRAQDERALQLGNASSARLQGDAGARIQGRGDGHARPSDAGELAHAESGGFGEFRDAPQPRRSGHGRDTLDLGNSNGQRPQGSAIGVGSIPEGREIPERQARLPGGVLNGFWHDAEWIDCTDGKARPVGPGSFPLGHGIQRRASKLRAYGNAIVPQVAAEFIIASQQAITA